MYNGLLKEGTISRGVEANIETVCSGSMPSPRAGGVAKLENANGISYLVTTKAGDKATDFYGVVTVSTGLQFDKVSGLGLANTLHSVLVNGYINVKCSLGTPMRGRKVYVNVTAGEFAATATLPDTAPDGTVEWPNAKWAADGKDSSNISEIYLTK